MSVDRLVLILEVRRRELAEIDDLRRQLVAERDANAELSHMATSTRDSREYWYKEWQSQCLATVAWKESADTWQRQYNDATRDLQGALGKLEAISAAIGTIVSPPDLDAIDARRYQYDDSPEDYPDHDNDDVPF